MLWLEIVLVLISLACTGVIFYFDLVFYKTIGTQLQDPALTTKYCTIEGISEEEKRSVVFVELSKKNDIKKAIPAVVAFAAFIGVERIGEEWLKTEPCYIIVTVLIFLCVAALGIVGSKIRRSLTARFGLIYPTEPSRRFYPGSVYTDLLFLIISLAITLIGILLVIFPLFV